MLIRKKIIIQKSLLRSFAKEIKEKYQTKCERKEFWRSGSSRKSNRKRKVVCEESDDELDYVYGV